MQRKRFHILHYICEGCDEPPRALPAAQAAPFAPPATDAASLAAMLAPFALRPTRFMPAAPGPRVGPPVPPHPEPPNEITATPVPWGPPNLTTAPPPPPPNLATVPLPPPEPPNLNAATLPPPELPNVITTTFTPPELPDLTAATPDAPPDAPGSPLFAPLAYDPAVDPQGEGLLHYQKYWYLSDVDVRVQNELLSGTPISLRRNTLCLINQQHRYFIPLGRVDYIRTTDGLDTSFDADGFFEGDPTVYEPAEDCRTVDGFEG